MAKMRPEEANIVVVRLRVSFAVFLPCLISAPICLLLLPLLSAFYSSQLGVAPPLIDFVSPHPPPPPSTPLTPIQDTSYVENPSTDSDSDRFSYTSSRSLASSITRYRYENGRRYHAYRDGSYYAPNDETYSNYETIVHHLWLLTLEDRLFLAPVDQLWGGAGPQRILDVGTGTGLWAV